MSLRVIYWWNSITLQCTYILTFFNQDAFNSKVKWLQNLSFFSSLSLSEPAHNYRLSAFQLISFSAFCMWRVLPCLPLLACLISLFFKQHTTLKKAFSQDLCNLINIKIPSNIYNHTYFNWITDQSLINYSLKIHEYYSIHFDLSLLLFQLCKS